MSDESEEETYEVHKIIDDKIEDGEKYYLIRWKGFKEWVFLMIKIFQNDILGKTIHGNQYRTWSAPTTFKSTRQIRRKPKKKPEKLLETI